MVADGGGGRSQGVPVAAPSTAFGMLPAIGVFMLAYMIVEGRTHPLRAVAIMLPFWLGAYFLFHEIMNTPWPRSLLGDTFPAIRALAGRGLI